MVRKFKCIMFLFLVFLFMSPLTFSVFAKPKKSDEYSFNVMKAQKWLKTKVYDPEVGLVSETELLSGSFWLHGDNYLTFEALEDRYPGFANQIFDKIVGYGYSGDSWYELAFNGNLEVYPFGKGVAYVVYEGDGFQIKSWDYSSGEIFDDFESYADLCMLKSVHSWVLGEYEDAVGFIEKAISLWDGVGFKDGSYTNCYDTYKIALFLACCNVIGYDCGELRGIIEETIWSLQDKDGGAWSHYLDIGERHPGCQQSVEATVMCVLAYKEPFNV